MIEINKTYKLKEEFFKELNISENQWKTRKEELIDWLANFFDYDIPTHIRPLTITIKEIYAEYSPLPRARNVHNKEQKIADYENFVINYVSTNGRHISKQSLASKAIEAFGREKYNHLSERSVAQHYITPALNKNNINLIQPEEVPKREITASHFQPIYGIYCIKIENKLVYVGKSRNIWQRIQQHKGCIEDPYTLENKYLVLRSALLGGFQVDFDIITYCNEDDDTLGELEGYYINLYNPPLNYQIPDEDDWHHYYCNENARVITLKQILSL